MNVQDAIKILGRAKYRECDRWDAFTGGWAGDYVIGFEKSGKTTGSFTVFEAIAIAEKLHREEQPMSTYKSTTIESEDLLLLEWRKKVDEQIATLLEAFDTFSDQACNTVRNLNAVDDNQQRRITALGESVIDATKRFATQAERIHEDHDKFRSRLDKLESAAFRGEWNAGKFLAIEHQQDQLAGRLEATRDKVNELCDDHATIMPLVD